MGAIAALSACGSGDDNGSTSTGGGSATTGDTLVDGIAGKLAPYEGDGKVGFSIYNGAVPHWNKVDIPELKKCLSQYAPNVELVTADPKGDAKTQTSQVQSMLSQGVNVLLLTPVAPTPTAILRAAKQNDVPVIDYVNPVVEAEEGDVVALVGDGPVPIGTAQAQWILDQNYPKGTKIALVNGDLATQYAQLMRRAQMEVLQPALDSGDLVLVGDKGAKNWDGAEAEKQMSAILVAHPDVGAVIAGADFLASGVISALKTINRAGEVDIIGLDADPIGVQNILLGNQTATVIKSSYNEMAVGCAAVIAALKGEEPPEDVFTDTWSENTAPIPFRDTPVDVVERDTLQKAFDWNLLTEEEACEGLPASVGEPCSSE
ncbi:MAG TPA: substrate-binding domain-containing protein [Capillimicrobium sp.]|nr:substrate-binding domain-containing protein [Capillimicrobium sp.]